MTSTIIRRNRREFLKAGLATGAGALFGARLLHAADSAAAPAVAAAQSSAPAAAPATPSKVALTHGDNRTENVFSALKSV